MNVNVHSRKREHGDVEGGGKNRWAAVHLSKNLHLSLFVLSTFIAGVPWGDVAHPGVVQADVVVGVGPTPCAILNGWESCAGHCFTRTKGDIRLGKKRHGSFHSHVDDHGQGWAFGVGGGEGVGRDPLKGGVVVQHVVHRGAKLVAARPLHIVCGFRSPKHEVARVGLQLQFCRKSWTNREVCKRLESCRRVDRDLVKRRFRNRAGHPSFHKKDDFFILLMHGVPRWRGGFSDPYAKEVFHAVVVAWQHRQHVLLQHHPCDGIAGRGHLKVHSQCGIARADLLGGRLHGQNPWFQYVDGEFCAVRAAGTVGKKPDTMRSKFNRLQFDGFAADDPAI